MRMEEDYTKRVQANGATYGKILPQKMTFVKRINSSVDRKQKWAIHPWPDHEGLLETINMPVVKSRNFV